MKKWLTDNPLVCFTLFALLIAFRDVFTQIFLSNNTDPLIIIFIFFVTTTITTLIYSKLQPIDSSKDESKRNPESFKVKIGLGLVTCLAFIITIYGIDFLGAPIYSLIEHCLIPLSTLLVASKMLGERVSKSMVFGIIVSLFSVFVFLYASTEIDLNDVDRINWYVGVGFAILSSFLTSISSAFQKKLVSFKYRADQVLYIRFILPTFLTAFLIFFWQKQFPSWISIMQISLFGCVFFTLPLLLLLQGFVRASLGRFSVFNILVPAMTFVVGSFFLKGEIGKWMNPWVISGIVGISLGYVVFEWKAITDFITKPKPQSKI